MLATLTLIAATGALVAVASGHGRDDRGAARNRIRMVRELWETDGCVSVATASIESSLAAARTPAALNAFWASLDSTVVRIAVPTELGCRLTLIPSGAALSLRSATPEQLSVLVGSFRPPAIRDSMVASLLDWTDPDSIASEYGAEADWYRNESRPLPRNGPVMDLQELRLIKGWESADDLFGLFAVEDARIVLDRAPRAILATVVGLPQEAIEWIDKHRLVMRGKDLSTMLDYLSGPARDAIAAQFSSLYSRTAAAPQTWILESSVPDSGGKGFYVRLTLTRAGSLLTIGARREGFL